MRKKSDTTIGIMVLEVCFVSRGYISKRYISRRKDIFLKWKFKTGSYVISSSAIGKDGTVYVGSLDGCLYAIYSESKGPADSPWPMFRHDLQHTGRFDYQGY